MADCHYDQLIRPEDFTTSTPSKNGTFIRRDGRLKPKRFDYKPAMLRTVSLALLFLYAIVLIGLLEYAAVAFPSSDDRRKTIPAVHVDRRRHTLDPDQTTSSVVNVDFAITTTQPALETYPATLDARSLVVVTVVDVHTVTSASVVVVTVSHSGSPPSLTTYTDVVSAEQMPTSAFVHPFGTEVDSGVSVGLAETSLPANTGGLGLLTSADGFFSVFDRPGETVFSQSFRASSTSSHSLSSPGHTSSSTSATSSSHAPSTLVLSTSHPSTSTLVFSTSHPPTSTSTSATSSSHISSTLVFSTSHLSTSTSTSTFTDVHTSTSISRAVVQTTTSEHTRPTTTTQHSDPRMSTTIQHSSSSSVSAGSAVLTTSTSIVSSTTSIKSSQTLASLHTISTSLSTDTTCITPSTSTHSTASTQSSATATRDSSSATTSTSSSSSSSSSRSPSTTTSANAATESPTSNVPQTGVSTTVVVLPSATSSSASNTTIQQQANNVRIYHWTPGKAFLGTYAPVILAVIFRLLMQIVLTDLSLIDPFRQLVSQDGAPAEHALFSFFQRPIKKSPLGAIFQGRWTLVGLTTAYKLASLMPALASEAIWTDTNYACEHPFYPGTNNPCEPRASVSPSVIRTLQSLLGFDALVILALGAVLWTGKTGLPANPSSIATIASLMQHPGLIEDLKEMPVGQDATMKTVVASLRGEQYTMGFWKNDDGAMSYGIRPLRSGQFHVQPQNSARYGAVSGGSSVKSRTRKSSIFRWKDLALVAVVLGLFAVVLAYYLDFADDGFDRFFNSNTFGPRFLLTGAATIIAGMWKSVEQSSMVMAPFIRLSQRPSPAASTLCFTPTNIPFLSTWKALRSRYWLLASLTLLTLLSDALSIVISGVPYATGRLYSEYLACTYASIAILGVMIVVAVVVVICRRTEPKIPVPPDTLGMKMYYLAGSKMLGDFEGVEWENAAVRDRRVNGLRKRYEFEDRVGSDGKRRWVVDEVEDEQT